MDVPNGFGLVPITPAPGAKLSGFGVRTAPSEGVHDPLHARAMALGGDADVVVLLVLDVIGVDAARTGRIRARLRAESGVPPERIAVSATHTHGGPSKRSIPARR